MLKSYRFVVTGRVQGVGFRAFAQRRARGLGLTGWVRNRPDGGVEGCVGGGEAAPLDAFRGFLERGPPGAQVTALEWRTSAEAPPGDDGFAILP